MCRLPPGVQPPDFNDIIESVVASAHHRLESYLGFAAAKQNTVVENDRLLSGLCVEAWVLSNLLARAYRASLVAKINCAVGLPFEAAATSQSIAAIGSFSIPSPFSYMPHK